MATYEGHAFLDDQIASIRSQSFSDWNLWVSDDSVGDETWRCLKRWKAELGARLSILRGRRNGVVANFMSLVCNSEISADYYAFSDQDDVWDHDKLERAVAWLSRLNDERPALYCSRTLLVDESNQTELGFSPAFARRPAFENALVQSIAGGNTMVFNDAARSLLIEAGPDVDVVMHDWWAYLVVAACGGEIYFDQTPSLRYRQHDRNLVGSGAGVLASLRRIREVHLKGVYRGWVDRNVAALERLGSQLTPESRRCLGGFLDARKKGPLERLLGLRASGVYRQTLVGSVSLYVSAFLGRL